MAVELIRLIKNVLIKDNIKKEVKQQKVVVLKKKYDCQKRAIQIPWWL